MLVASGNPNGDRVTPNRRNRSLGPTVPLKPLTPAHWSLASAGLLPVPVEQAPPPVPAQPTIGEEIRTMEANLAELRAVQREVSRYKSAGRHLPTALVDRARRALRMTQRRSP